MTTATDTTMHLTPEQVGVIQGAIKSHLLSLGSDFQANLDRYSEKPDLASIDRVGRKLRLCSGVLADAECGFLHVDDEGLLDLLGECGVEEEESADYYSEKGDNEPDTVAIIRGRAAHLRDIRDLARRRLDVAGGGA
jgi:hypothetical protein